MVQVCISDLLHNDSGRVSDEHLHESLVLLQLTINAIAWRKPHESCEECNEWRPDALHMNVEKEEDLFDKVAYEVHNK